MRFGKEETSTEDKRRRLRRLVPPWSFLTRQRFLLEKQKKMLCRSRKFVLHISLSQDFRKRQRLPLVGETFDKRTSRSRILLRLVRLSKVSPTRGSLWRFRKSCERLICSTNLRLRHSIFFCFSKRKRWRVRNDHGGTSRRKRRLLSSVLVSSFPNRKLNLRFGSFPADLRRPLSQLR